MATEAIDRSHEHKMTTMERMPPSDTAIAATSTPTTETHITLVTATATTYAHTDGENVQLCRAFAVLLRRSMLIGPLWCKVAPLMAKIIEFISKLQCEPVTAVSKATHLIGRVLCDYACKFLERLTTPKGEYQG